MNPQSSRNVLNWNQEELVVFPSPGRERRLAIRCSDWERLKRRLSHVKNPTPKLSVLYSILFGIAASSGISIIPIVTSRGLPSWVTPLYICVFVFSLFCGCVFAWLDRKLQSGNKSELQDIETDMKDIENNFNLT